MHLPINQGYITIRGKDVKNCFGWGGRKNDDGTPKPHQGWDISAFVGTPVKAIANGVIEYVRHRRKVLNDEGKLVEAPYGNEICMSFNFKGKTLYAQFAHLQKMSVVPGQFVGEGEVIGTVGQTGNAEGQHYTEAHLHFEIRETANGGAGLNGRLDPAIVLGAGPLIEAIFSDFPKFNTPLPK